MAAPRADSYTGASGTDLVVGRDDVGTIVAGVWTPGKGSGGLNTDGTWNSLPLDQWVRTSGTSFQQIRSQLLIGGYDITDPNMNFGNSRNMANCFRDWSSPAMDLANGRFWLPPSGGHEDSTFNGIVNGDLEKMGSGGGWYVESMPTIFTTDANIPATATYRSNAQKNFMAWQPAVDSPPEEVAFSWPDFIPNKNTGLFYRPTARHHYGGWYYDSIRNHLVSTRTSLIRYSLTSHSYVSRQRPVVAGVEEPIDLNGFGYGAFCAATDRFVGNLPHTRSGTGRDDLGYFEGASPVRNNLAMNSPVLADQNQAWTPLSADVQLAIANDGAGGVKYGTVDIRLLTRPSGAAAPITNGMPSTNDHPAICYIAQRADGRYAGGKVLRRLNDNSGTWRIIDWATKTESAWTPAGLPPPFAAQPGGWMFLYTRHDGQAFVIYISAVDDTSDAVYVMRVGT